MLTKSVTVLLVLGSERLYSEMKRRFSAPGLDEPVTIIKLDKSGGCVDRDETYMRKFREAQIKEYFYGHGNMGLSPFTQLVEYNQVTIYRINDGNYLQTLHILLTKHLKALHTILLSTLAQMMTMKMNMSQVQYQLDSTRK